MWGGAGQGGGGGNRWSQACRTSPRRVAGFPRCGPPPFGVRLPEPPGSAQDRVVVAVDGPAQRGVQAEVALAQEAPLGGLDPRHVVVRRLLVHLHHALVEEGVETSLIVQRRRRTLEGARRPR